jgi:hypothetical protein
MDMTSSAWAEQRNGTIEISELPPLRLGATDFWVRRQLYRWRPPHEIEAELPQGYPIALECWIKPDGTRRFITVDRSQLGDAYDPQEFEKVSTAAGFALAASIGGAWLRRDRGELDAAWPFNELEAFLITRYIIHRREYLGATTRLEKAISICAGGRRDRSAKNTLPQGLGLNADDEGEEWSADRLTKEGLQAARAAGVKDPDAGQILRFGLMDAAKQAPWCLEGEDARWFVRISLFGSAETDEAVTPDQLSYMAARVGESLRDHIDDTDEQFDKWVEDPKSNLVHRISKQKDCGMKRAHVRKVLLELGWRAFLLLAESISTQMRAFRDAILEPLNELEAHYFDQLFVGSPMLGGIPLLLLSDRVDFLREAIINAWTNPGDREAIGILHKIMYYYSELIGNRREADRIYKRHALRKREDGHVVLEQTPPVDIESHSQARDNVTPDLIAMANEERERRRLRGD